MRAFMMSVAVQDMPGYLPNDQHVSVHKLPSSQTDTVGFINDKPAKDSSYHPPFQTSSRQRFQPTPLTQQASYDKYARTKQRSARSKKQSSRPGSVIKDSKDSETIRRFSAKYSGSPDNPVAPSPPGSVIKDNKDPETIRRFRAKYSGSPDNPVAPSPPGSVTKDSKDPETIRRFRAKYAGCPDNPVAPPTTPVSNLRFKPSPVSPRPSDFVVDGELQGWGQSEVSLERCESRQGKFHEECTPRIDPTNVIGSRNRREKLNSARSSESSRRRRPSSLASTSSSLLTHRESVVNVVFTGTEDFTGSETQCTELPLARRRASTVLAKMTSLTTHPDDVIHGEYDVMQEDDYSLCSRMTRNRSCPSLNSISTDRLPQRAAFLYQIVNFDTLAHSVPSFVKQNVQKNGRLVTETFILNVNYLRRRRAVGDMSTVGNNNNNSNHHNKPVKTRAHRGEHGGSSDHL